MDIRHKKLTPIKMRDLTLGQCEGILTKLNIQLERTKKADEREKILRKIETFGSLFGELENKATANTVKYMFERYFTK